MNATTGRPSNRRPMAPDAMRGAARETGGRRGPPRRPGAGARLRLAPARCCRRSASPDVFPHCLLGKPRAWPAQMLIAGAVAVCGRCRHDVRRSERGASTPGGAGLRRPRPPRRSRLTRARGLRPEPCSRRMRSRDSRSPSRSAVVVGAGSSSQAWPWPVRHAEGLSDLDSAAALWAHRHGGSLQHRLLEDVSTLATTGGVLVIAVVSRRRGVGAGAQPDDPGLPGRGHDRRLAGDERGQGRYRPGAARDRPRGGHVGAVVPERPLVDRGGTLRGPGAPRGAAAERRHAGRRSPRPPSASPSPWRAAG